MLVKVEKQDLAFLRQLQMETYRDTFGNYIGEADLEDYFANSLSEQQIAADLDDRESETYFVINDQEDICGFFESQLGVSPDGVC